MGLILGEIDLCRIILQDIFFGVLGSEFEGQGHVQGPRRWLTVWRCLVLHLSAEISQDTALPLIREVATSPRCVCLKIIWGGPLLGGF